MRWLFFLAGLLWLGSPAWAADPQIKGETIVGAWGQLVTFTATNHALAPGFEAEWVSICAVPGATTAGTVFIREGRTLALATTTDTGAVTAAIFQNGDAGNVEGQALVLTPHGGNTEPYCLNLPWRVDGLVLHSAATGTSSVDVRFYQTRRN